MEAVKKLPNQTSVLAAFSAYSKNGVVPYNGVLNLLENKEEYITVLHDLILEGYILKDNQTSALSISREGLVEVIRYFAKFSPDCAAKLAPDETISLISA